MPDLTTQLAKFLEQLYRGTVGGLGNGVSAWTFNAGTSVVEVSDGIVRVVNAAGTDFSRLILGTNDTSGIAITKSGPSFQFNLGDNSGPASIQVNGLNASGIITAAFQTATPAGGSTAARLLFGTTAGFGIYYGSGAPTVSAAQGSLYLRSNGTGTADRIYVNTNGSTTWTNLTSAA